MSELPPTEPVAPPAAPAGLSTNAAGALAYVTIIPAIIFLLVEPYNKSSFVRFHAWQSIFFCIGAVAVQVILSVIPVIGWIILPFAMVGLLLIWVWVLLKAMKCLRYKLPIIGKLAEQQAGN
jgi:uncharacterized membrane protein